MTPLKAELIKRLEAIPGVTHRPWPERDDGFSTIHFGGKEIGHFHSANELDLRLGRKLIERSGLKHPHGSACHPKRSANSQFIELRFDGAGDLDRIVALIALLVDERA